MVMHGFDTNFDRENEIYAVNGIGFAYMDAPIRVKRGELVRIYLVNVTEYDPINSLHIHGNFFHYFPTGHVARAGRVHRHGHAVPGPARDPRAALPARGALHVPRAPVRVHGAGMAGVLRRPRLSPDAGPAALAAWGSLPLALVALAVGALRRCSTARASASARGPPVEELAVERTVLEPGVDRAAVRNDGPDAVRIAQAQVNDAFVAFERRRARRSAAWRPRRVRLRTAWVEGEAYTVALLTSTGGTIAHEIPRRRRDARRRPVVLRPDGAARHLRRRHPGGARDAVAAVDPADPAGVAARR